MCAGVLDPALVACRWVRLELKHELMSVVDLAMHLRQRRRPRVKAHLRAGGGTERGQDGGDAHPNGRENQIGDGGEGGRRRAAAVDDLPRSRKKKMDAAVGEAGLGVVVRLPLLLQRVVVVDVPLYPGVSSMAASPSVNSSG